jgi:hypothetical protein
VLVTENLPANLHASRRAFLIVHEPSAPFGLLERHRRPPGGQGTADELRCCAQVTGRIDSAFQLRPLDACCPEFRRSSFIRQQSS